MRPYRSLLRYPHVSSASNIYCKICLNGHHPLMLAHGSLLRDVASRGSVRMRPLWRYRTGAGEGMACNPLCI